MRVEDFDALMEAHKGKVSKAAIHPDDVMELADGQDISGPIFTHKGVILVSDPTVTKGSLRILEAEDMSGKRACPECGNPTYQKGLCLTCRVDDLEAELGNVDGMLTYHQHALPIPLVPGGWTGIARMRDDLTSPGTVLGPPDEEGFQSFVPKHNHDDNEQHLETCPGCRVEAGPTKQVGGSDDEQTKRLRVEGHMCMSIGDWSDAPSGKELRIGITTTDPTSLFPFEDELRKYTVFDSGYGYGQRDIKIPLPGIPDAGEKVCDEGAVPMSRICDGVKEMPHCAGLDNDAECHKLIKAGMCWMDSQPKAERESNQELQIGDLIVRKSHPTIGGFDVFVIPPGMTDQKQELEFKCFFNEKGALGLRDWITETHTKPGSDLTQREVQVGSAVNYWDNDGERHNALVIHVWSDTNVNLVYVDNSPIPEGASAEGDEFGRKRKHPSSVPYNSDEEVTRHTWTW